MGLRVRPTTPSIAVITFVLPVPGGPWMRAMSGVVSAISMARRWRSVKPPAGERARPVSAVAAAWRRAALHLRPTRGGGRGSPAASLQAFQRLAPPSNLDQVALDRYAAPSVPDWRVIGQDMEINVAGDEIHQLHTPTRRGSANCLVGGGCPVVRRQCQLLAQSSLGTVGDLRSAFSASLSRKSRAEGSWGPTPDRDDALCLSRARVSGLFRTGHLRGRP